MKYEVIETNYNINVSTGPRGDNTIRLTRYQPRKFYPEPFRLVKYYDSENDEELEFISNNFEISALQIANIYRNRWQIETFFKWIKGNLTIKALWGHSENAVKIQLWIAVCTYLLVAIIKAKCGSDYSITEVEMLLRVSIFERMNIRDLPLSQPINYSIKIKMSKN